MRRARIFPEKEMWKRAVWLSLLIKSASHSWLVRLVLFFKDESGTGEWPVVNTPLNQCSLNVPFDKKLPASLYLVGVITLSLWVGVHHLSA